MQEQPTLTPQESQAPESPMCKDGTVPAAQASTFTLDQVLEGVFDTVMKTIEKDISSSKRKVKKAVSLKDILAAQQQVKHFEGLRSHLRSGLFDLQDQVALLPGGFTNLEEAVEVVLGLVQLHLQGHSGAPAPARAAGLP